MKTCMAPAGYRMTHHAQQRARERRISTAAIELVLQYGRLLRAGRYSLSGAPKPLGVGSMLWREATAVVVVVDSSGRIPNVFRRRKR